MEWVGEWLLAFCEILRECGIGDLGTRPKEEPCCRQGDLGIVVKIEGGAVAVRLRGAWMLSLGTEAGRSDSLIVY